MSKKQDRKRLSRKVLFPLLVMLAGILTITGFTLHQIVYPKASINKILANADLAKLPESIKDLIVETRPVRVSARSGKRKSVPNQCALFIRFQADPNVIGKFIASSPSIHEDFFLPCQRTYEDRDAAPTWWRPEQGAPVRICGFPGQSDLPEGSVLVDDENNTVHILVFHIKHPLFEGVMPFFSKSRRQAASRIYQMKN